MIGESKGIILFSRSSPQILVLDLAPSMPMTQRYLSNLGFLYLCLERRPILLISCSITNGVWNSCKNWIGVNSANHFALKEHFEQFQCTWFSKKGNKLWKGVWVSIIWWNIGIVEHGSFDEPNLWWGLDALLLWLKLSSRVFRILVQIILVLCTKLNQSMLKEENVFLSKEKNNRLKSRYNQLFYT